MAMRIPLQLAAPAHTLLNLHELKASITFTVKTFMGFVRPYMSAVTARGYLHAPSRTAKPLRSSCSWMASPLQIHKLHSSPYHCCCCH